MSYPVSRLVLGRLALAALLACGLTACQPPAPKPVAPEDAAAAALEARGYTHAPAITSVAASNPGFIVIGGDAPADSRVRFAFADSLKGGAQAVGVTADGQGHFHAEVPVTAAGGLYDVTVDDGGRPRQAEGRLFVPPGRPDKAVLMRPGAPSRLLQPGALGVMVADYDAAGAFAVSGRVAPDADVTVMVNDEIRAQVHSDAKGDFDAETQVPPPGPEPQAVTVVVQAAKASFRRDLQVVNPSAGDYVTPITAGWRADWKLPGGGGQSTVVFAP